MNMHDEVNGVRTIDIEFRSDGSQVRAPLGGEHLLTYDDWVESQVEALACV